MNEATKMKPDTTPAETQPSNSQKNDKEIPAEELGKVAGGRRSNDPCEGGQITE